MGRRETEKAKAYFDGDYNCAQSVLRAVLEDRVEFKDALPYLSAGLGGGIAFSGNVCGAVSGAVLAIGVLVSLKTEDIKSHKTLTYDYAEEFFKRFKEEFGSVLCNDLIGLDISDPVAFQKAMDEGRFQKICPKHVERAVELVLDIVDI